MYVCMCELFSYGYSQLVVASHAGLAPSFSPLLPSFYPSYLFQLFLTVAVVLVKSPTKKFVLCILYLKTDL